MIEKKAGQRQEIADQIEVTRKQQGTDGVIHFSMKALMRDHGLAGTVRKIYTEPALVPDTPWLAQGKGPAKPEVVRESADDKDVLRITAEAGTRFVVVRGLSEDFSSTLVRGLAADGQLIVPLPKADRVVVSVLDRTGRESEAVEVK